MRALLLVAVVCLVVACESTDDDDDGVLTGDCDAGTAHCIGTDSIQYCADSEWGEPEECPPEVAGEFGLEVQTYCVDDACRPGG